MFLPDTYQDQKQAFYIHWKAQETVFQPLLIIDFK